jgi:hypothetical protein
MYRCHVMDNRGGLDLESKGSRNDKKGPSLSGLAAEEIATWNVEQVRI